MLSVLHIENVAVIERADIEFSGGFNVLTGETGAGKSILIDAISAVLGERTSRDIIRTGARHSQVSAVFTELSATVHDWLEQNGLCAEDGSVIVQREIFSDGRNACRVGGRPVNVALLKELGVRLVNIHGQHDSQKLLDDEFHITYVDGFGNNESLLSAYTDCYDELGRIRRDIDSLTMDENEKNRLVENLSYQINELRRADLRDGEEEELASTLKILQSADKVRTALDDSFYAIYGGDGAPGISELLSGALHSLSGVSDLSTELDSLLKRVYDLKYLADDISESLRDMRGEFDSSPEDIDAAQSRLDLLQRLKRKYGGSVSEMLSYLEKCAAELERIEVSGDELKKLHNKYELQYKKAAELADALTESRKKAAVLLEQRIITELAELDMTNPQFKVEFDSSQTLGADGQDKVRFLISVNMGEALKPLGKVASGGELARIMLALKNVLAESDDVGTLIFDEVDAGVSGRAAQKVAHKLKTVAGKKQVLCITHLPQIASAADIHFKIEKSEESGRTFTMITKLGYDERKYELARIIGGAKITDKTLESAAELLEQNS